MNPGDLCRFVRSADDTRWLVEHVAPCEHPAGTITDLLTGRVLSAWEAARESA